MNMGFGVGLYSPRVAAKVARVRYQHFQAWARAQLIRPIRTGKESVYTYHDLLRLRLILRLRQQGIRPKNIKKALDTVAQMSGGDANAWLKATLYVDAGVIVAMIPARPDWNPVAASRGPQKMAVIFFPELVKELERELVPPSFQYIEVRPDVLGGSPVIRGTRIPTKTIVLLKQSGQDPAQAYPDLTAEQINEAESYEAFLEAA